jgi:phosphoribosylaminoimidazole (AIR) synthetase
MGIGMEIITDKENVDYILDICDKYRVGAKIIGKCEESSEGNLVIIKSKWGVFSYS